MHWNKYTPAHRHTTNDLSHTPPPPPDLAITDSSSFGSAGTRTDTQKAAALDSGSQLITSTSSSYFIAYTDGSAKPIKLTTSPPTDHSHTLKKPRTTTPGPCGAGACLVFPRDTPNLPDILAIGPLGNGTNNIGELYAIGMAIDMF
jgi:hypothetical protein